MNTLPVHLTEKAIAQKMFLVLESKKRNELAIYITIYCISAG